jgi:DNA polymerase-3 subunit beta
LNVISVKYACSTSDTRPILKGVCLNNDLIVATDSHRLAKKEITFENNVKSNIVIPKYALDYIEKFQNKKVSGNIEVLATSEKISDSVTDYKCIKFVFENIEMQVRPIQGNYPDVRRIIPENFKTEYKINKSKLVEELKLMAEISETLVIRYTKEGINLFAKTSDKRNTLESNLDVEYITYDNLEYIGFNPQYVLEALERLEGDIMTFRYTGKDTPFMINDEALILPIRLTNINEYVA